MPLLVCFLETVMLWRFDGSGEWEAFSAVGDQSAPPVWRIQVCDDGTFDVNQSDDGLIARKYGTFGTLRAAKTACENGETARKARSAYRHPTADELRQEAEMERSMLGSN